MRRGNHMTSELKRLTKLLSYVVSQQAVDRVGLAVRQRSLFPRTFSRLGSLHRRQTGKRSRRKMKLFREACLTISTDQPALTRGEIDVARRSAAGGGNLQSALGACRQVAE